MQVRSGRGGVHADAGFASEQLKRLTRVLPKARAEGGRFWTSWAQ